MPNPTIKTIAREAGVSTATVSKALNDMPDISESVKVRIREIAKRQGYTINSAARQLASGRASTVGVILPDISSATVAEVYKAISARLSAAGYSVFLNDSESSPHNEAMMSLQMLQRRVGALIVMPTSNDVLHIEEAVRGQIPIVYVGAAPGLVAENAVLCDDFKGGNLAARHLYHAGHRDAAVFTAGQPGTLEHERTRGFVEYMQSHNARVRVHHAAGPAGEEAGAALAYAAAAQGKLPGAVFATGDLMAIGAMGAMPALGRRVPEDVSIVGYGDLPSAGLGLIRLTTVRAPKSELGICAGDLAVQLVHGEVTEEGQPPLLRHMTLEPQLVKRDTVARIG